MQMILRPASAKDLPAIRKSLKSWCEEDPGLAALLDTLFDANSRERARCTVLESENAVRCVAVWTRESEEEIRLHGLGLAQTAQETGADARFLKEEIIEWADTGASRVLVKVPQTVSVPLVKRLRACGFIFEGTSSTFNVQGSPRIRLCKYFRYGSVPYSEVMSLLEELLTSLGCEIRPEGDGFGYRIRAEYRLPFVFSAWHRITRSETDIIVHPPARVLAMDELETLFFPLRIECRNEKPLFLPLERKRAKSLIDVPNVDTRQDSLFGSEVLQPYRRLFLNNITYCYPAGLKRMRRGLPLLFYVNGVGIVGSGRVEDWHLDEPSSLYNSIDEMGYFDPEDVKEHAAESGPLEGKVLVIRFQWYRPFRRTVTLDEIRKLEAGFNPQRTRALSTHLFHAIMAAGNPAG